MIYRFGDFSLDAEQRELRQAGLLRPLEPQVFDLLEYLIRNRERVVSRDELLNSIWHGRSVSDSVLTTRINAARSAIGDNGVDQRLIRTLRTKGVRFVGVVRAEDKAAAKASQAAPGETAGYLLERPTIAVLPFANIGGDPKHDAFADGITEELVTALAKAGWLSVASRNSTFSYRAKSLPTVQAADALGVRYVLEGGVRYATDRVRVTAQLIDAITGHQLWAERYERTASTAFAVQDEIIGEVLEGAIEPQLYFAEELRARRKAPQILNAWECMVRALSLMNSRQKRHVAVAHDLLQTAIALDPEYEQLHSLHSMVTTLGVHMGWTRAQTAIPDAEAAAQKALSLNTDDPWGYAALGYALIWRHPAEAIRPLERAIALDPNFAIGHYFLALASTYAGHGEHVFEHADRAERLARRDLLARGYAGAHNNVRATACFAAERFSEGVTFARNAVLDLPSSPTAYRALTINLARAGEIDQARASLQTLKRLAPDFSQDWLAHTAMWADHAKMKLYFESFLLAGLE